MIVFGKSYKPNQNYQFNKNAKNQSFTYNSKFNNYYNNNNNFQKKKFINNQYLAFKKRQELELQKEKEKKEKELQRKREEAKAPIIKNINSLYFYRPKIVSFKKKFQYLTKSVLVKNMTYYASVEVSEKPTDYKRDYEKNFSNDLKEKFQLKNRLILNKKTNILGTRHQKRLTKARFVKKKKRQGYFIKIKNTKSAYEASFAKDDLNKIYYNFYQNQIDSARYNAFDGKEYNNKNNFNNINKFLTNVNKRVDFDKNVLNFSNQFFRSNKIFNLLNYSATVKMVEQKKLPNTIFLIFFTKKKNNFFININTNYNKLLYKLSVGHLNIKGKERRVILTIKKLASFFRTFCQNNNFFGNTVCLRAKSYRIFKLSTFLSKSNLKLNFFKRIKYLHSKPPTQRKKKRL